MVSFDTNRTRPSGSSTAQGDVTALAFHLRRARLRHDSFGTPRFGFDPECVDGFGHVGVRTSIGLFGRGSHRRSDTVAGRRRNVDTEFAGSSCKRLIETEGRSSQCDFTGCERSVPRLSTPVEDNRPSI